MTTPNPAIDAALSPGLADGDPNRGNVDMHAIEPRTAALREALALAPSEAVVRDLLYLESWEMAPEPGAGPALRINQLRRANPELAAAIRAELSRGPM